MKNSSARHTSKSSRSETVKKQHGMKLRSDKKESVDDLCEIVLQQEKENRSLRARVKRLEAAIAAKDNTIEEVSARLEEVLGLAVLHGLDLHLDPAPFQVYEDPDNENKEQGSSVGPSDSSQMPLGEIEGEGTFTWHINVDQDADTADHSSEEQNPQDSGEQGNGDVVTTLPVATDAGRMLVDMPTGETSRGKKRQREDADGDDLSRKKFRD